MEKASLTPNLASLDVCQNLLTHILFSSQPTVAKPGQLF